jgi:hypothetical protein
MVGKLDRTRDGQGARSEDLPQEEKEGEEGRGDRRQEEKEEVGCSPAKAVRFRAAFFISSVGKLTKIHGTLDLFSFWACAGGRDAIRDRTIGTSVSSDRLC